MLNIFRRLDADNFQTVLIERKEDIWPSFKAFLGKDRGAREQALRRAVATYALKDLEYWDARIREKVEEFGLDCYPQEFELCDHNQMLGYMAYSGHAVALPALVVRQGLREAEDAVRPRRLGSALRDGHQLESRPRLPHAGQHPLPPDPHHRPRLRPQRLLQEQLHLPARRAPSSPSARSSRTPTACGRYVEDAEHRRTTRSRTSSTPPTRSRSSAGATSPCSKLSAGEERDRLIGRRGPAARSVPEDPQAPGARRGRPRSARRRRPRRTSSSSSATTIRSSPTGSATSSPSSTRRRSTSSRRSRPRS